MKSIILTLAFVCMCYRGAESTKTEQYRGYFRDTPRHPLRPSSNTPSTVGFTAVKTADQESSTDGVITFDKVITNVGKAYKASDSNVHIPTTGLYYFSFSVRTQTSDRETIDLVQNGKVLVSAKGFTAANGAVVFAKKGDNVHVRARAGSVVVSSTHSTKTTFSGYLIINGYFGYH